MLRCLSNDHVPATTVGKQQLQCMMPPPHTPSPPFPLIPPSPPLNLLFRTAWATSHRHTFAWRRDPPPSTRGHHHHRRRRRRCRCPRRRRFSCRLRRLSTCRPSCSSSRRWSPWWAGRRGRGCCLRWPFSAPSLRCIICVRYKRYDTIR